MEIILLTLSHCTVDNLTARNTEAGQGLQIPHLCHNRSLQYLMRVDLQSQQTGLVQDNRICACISGRTQEPESRIVDLGGCAPVAGWLQRRSNTKNEV